MAGPSGVGKGTIATALVARDPALWLSQSWTTRPPRAGEAADAYRYVDRATFDAHVAAGGFLEWATVFGHRYGTPVPDPPPGYDVLLEIDVQGARQVKQRDPGAVVVFVVAPSRQVQEERLRGRGDPPETVERRLRMAAAEEAAGRALADHVVVNDDLQRAVAEVAGIVEAARAGTRRRPERPDPPAGPVAGPPRE